MNCCPGVRHFFGFCAGFVVAAGFFVALSQLPAAAAKDEESKLLRHVVLFKFKDSASEADVKKVVDAFRENCLSKIPAVADFEYGTNNSPEGPCRWFDALLLHHFQEREGPRKPTCLIQLMLPLSKSSGHTSIKRSWWSILGWQVSEGEPIRFWSAPNTLGKNLAKLSRLSCRRSRSSRCGR